MVTPMRLIGTPKRLDSPQIRRSHMIASSSPPPTHRPWIIAIVGCTQSAIAPMVSCISRP